MSLNDGRHQAQWVFTGNPETVNEETDKYPGTLGSYITHNDKTYQRVKLDSGASNGIAAANNQVVTWKDSSKFLVTTDLRFSEAGRNAPAGVLHTAVTNGYFCFVQVGGRSNIKTAGSPAAGGLAVVNSGTAADVTPVAEGTAPTHVVVGVYRGAAVSSVAPVNLTLLWAQ